jgi:photosystem II stability/assembly factor-like uncharacterized protein
MKTIIVLVALAAFGCLNSLHAQPLWEQTNGPGGSTIISMNFDSSGGVYVTIGVNLYTPTKTLRSTDGGASWQQLPIIIPYVTTLSNGDLFDGTNISKDIGQTWTPVVQGSSSFASTPDGNIYVNTPKHILHSADGGVTWDSLGTPPPIAGNLFVSYLGTLFCCGSSTLYRSTDEGRSWAKVVNGWQGSGSEPGTLVFGAKGLVTYLDVNNYGTSNDDGRTWTSSRQYIDVKPALAISRSGRIGFGNRDGLVIGSQTLTPPIKQESNFRLVGAAPSGEFWFVYGPHLFKTDSKFSKLLYVPIPSGTVESMLALAVGKVIATSGDGLYGNNGGSYHGNTLFRTTSGGWSGVPGTTSYGDNGEALSSFAVDSNHNIIASRQGLIQKSKDEGLTWKPVGQGFTTSIPTIVVDPTGYIYAGCREGVFRSTDDGATWDQLNYGLTSTNILSLTVNSAGDVFAGTSKKIFRTTDHALSWEALPFTPPDSSGITSMVVNTDGDVLAAVKSSGIFWSHDNGNSWGEIGAGLKGKVNAMLSTPIGHVFAATDQGVYYLEVGGGAWVDANAGLTSLNVLSITRDPAGTVYLGTDGAGVFRSTQTYNIIQHQQAVQRMPSESNDLALKPVYPNPVTSSATLAFSIPSSSVVRVELLNALGEIVKLLADENLSAGGYTVPVDASELANGVYHVRLITTAGVKMQNIVVAR